MPGKYTAASLLLAGAIIALALPQAGFSDLEPNQASFSRADTDNAFALLKARKDKRAIVVLEEILQRDPENCDALWGKAEILRRTRRFGESETILQQILRKDPHYPSAMLSLAYIRYNSDDLNAALKLVKQALREKNLTRENRAVAFMMLGAVNSRRSSQGWLLNKIQYGTQIKSYFLKAEREDPSLPEVHLGLGTFYLKAPAIAGGNLDKSISELQTALELAPDFATATARLAQAYKKKGDLEKYSLYLQKAKELDPGNEVLVEIEEKTDAE